MWDWIKRNKFIILVLLVLFYLFVNLSSAFYGIDTLSLNIPESRQSGSINLGPGGSYGALSGVSSPSLPSVRTNTYTPQTDVSNRMVVQESSISLLVKNVVDARNKILDHAKNSGGYMVHSSTSNPQDAPTASITLRVPSDKLQDALNYFHSLSVKVVSENLVGTDVTDQYVDIETRIAQLERTKERMEALLNQATEIQEISNLTQQVLNYQNQIDSLKGQQMSLEQNSKLARITIYLSTDEIALPYSPSETFRPAVVFKLAVRSLVKTLRGVATLGIWLLVYSVIWLPAVLIIRFLRKWIDSRRGTYPTPQVKK